MKANKVKSIAIKFEPLSENDATTLHAFLSQQLLKKTVTLDTPESGAKNLRGVFRVMNRGAIGKLTMVTVAMASVPQQEIAVEIINISIGGGLFSMANDVALVKGGIIYFTLDCVQPAISFQGTILGRRGQ